MSRPGFFIPYRYAAAVDPSGVHGPSLASLRAGEAGFAAVLARCDAYADSLQAIPADAPAGPRWRQDWFPSLDAAVAYVLVRDRKPRRIVEIGSGHSTRFLARAIADGRLATELAAVDPAPRAALRDLPVRWVEALVQDADPTLFAALQPGDILSIDSSHILMPGTDVDLLLGGVLPGLMPGVLVHIHDIMLPDPYPMDWAWRGYNEQQAVAILLGAGGWTILFASHYAATRMRGAVAASVVGRLPVNPAAPPGSLWLEKRAPAG